MIAMSAIELYRTLPESRRLMISERVMVITGSRHDTDLDDVIDHPDHPALIEAMRWWWHMAVADDVFSVIDARGHDQVQELAIVLCAESVAHLARHPCVAECRRVRFAWVQGKATDGERSKARIAANDEKWAGIRYSLNIEASEAAGAAASLTVAQAALSAASAEDLEVSRQHAMLKRVAMALRTLFPDPCNMDHRDAITRWEIAVAQVQQPIK